MPLDHISSVMNRPGEVTRQGQRATIGSKMAPFGAISLAGNEADWIGTDWRAGLARFGTEISLRRDHEIFAQGEDADFCYMVIEGCVRTVRLMEDGRRQITDFHFASDLLGMDDLAVHACSAESVGDVVLLRLPRQIVEQLASHNGALANHLRAAALDELRRAHERMLLLGRKTALERLSTFLVELAFRMPANAAGRTQTAEPARLELPMSRLDIADHLGLTVETVCRNLAVLQKQGIVKVHGTSIHLMQWRSLEQLAEMPHQPLPARATTPRAPIATPRAMTAMQFALAS